MDPQTLALQERLHRDNQERLRRMEDIQTKQVETLARIEENTKHLPDLDDRLRALELHKEQQAGAIEILNRFGGLIGVLVGAGLEWLMHHLFGK